MVIYNNICLKPNTIPKINESLSTQAGGLDEKMFQIYISLARDYANDIPLYTIILVRG